MATTSRASITQMDEGSRQKEVVFNSAIGVIDTALWTDMGEFTLAGLPAAASNPNAYALVTNAAGGRTVVRSNGTTWKIISTEGATVS